MKTSFTFAAIAAGAGLGSRGFELAGGKCLSVVEIDAARKRCNSFHRPSASQFSDLRVVTGRQIGDVDALFLTTPCPSFSAGNRSAIGLSDDRGALLFHGMRLVEEIRPKAVVLENVPAMLHSLHENDVAACLELPQSLGYSLVFQETLDARYFGVPQSRKRLFFIWTRSDVHSRPLQLPACQDIACLKSVPESWLGPELSRSALELLKERINRHGKPGFAHLADAFIGQGAEPDEWQGKPIFHCNHSNSAFGVAYMVTLTKTGRALVRWKGKVHTLSVEAWEELMGLPPGYTAPIGSHAQRRQACGDGIVVPVATAVGQLIADLLRGAR